MDIFQGWYKDGTEGTRDYRSFSAIYLIVRIGLGCELIVIIYKENQMLWELAALGVLHVVLGMLLFTANPYKRLWMSHMDGLIFTLVGVLLLMELFDSKPVYILGAVIGFSVMVLTGLYVACKCAKEGRKICNFVRDS